MIVYDLACPDGHRFEGWFGCSSEYEEQFAAELIACPECGSVAIGKAPMAPSVGRKGNQQGGTAPVRQSADAVSGGAIPAEVAKALDSLAKIQAKALENSEYVGDKFAETSRAMHYGEREAATIHGKATETERRELLDEGIAVAPLLAPFVPPDEVN